MKKFLVTFVAWILPAFVLVCFVPAFGQQLSSPSRANVHSFGRLARATTEASNTGQALIASTTPAWTEFFQFTPHTGLDFQSAVYDPATNTMIVFGGADAGLAFELTNAVLVRANANGSGDWSTLIANGTAGSPTTRSGHTAVYDSANNRMIVFGGGNVTPFNDLWVLSGANGQAGTPVWTQLSPTGTPPAPRFGHTAVYDAANNRMTIFAGSDNTQSFNDVWVLSNANGLGGTPAWTQLSPSGGPPNGIGDASAVYDPVNNIMTVFGGINFAFTADTNAVWTLSHANGQGGTPVWTQLSPTGTRPAKRDGHTAAYDVTHNRMIIFGGLNNFLPTFPVYDDVWVLTNANGLGGTPTWTKLLPTGLKPGPRFGHTAVYDAVNNLLIVSAGENFDAQFYITWVLSNANGL